VKFELVKAEKAHYPVAVLCSVLSVSRSGFYAWQKRPAQAARARADAALVIEIRAAHHLGRGVYGSPRVHAELKAKGVCVSEKRVARLMREGGLRARQKRRFRRTTDSNHTDPIAPNVLQRDFEPLAPNQSWATDVTYIHTLEGWLYLAAILDLFSRRVVGWAMSSTNDRALALDALGRALSVRNPPGGLVHHSDRGSPYASEDYRRALELHGIIPSMSRTGDCWDNAVAESFFASLKAELVDHERYASHAAAIKSIGDYIDNFYNPLRRHSHLGYLNPIEYELRARVAALAA
jgi:transposase InsO family protein